MRSVLIATGLTFVIPILLVLLAGTEAFQQALTEAGYSGESVVSLLSILLIAVMWIVVAVRGGD